MNLEPYAISRAPQGYRVTLNGEQLSLHRRRRDALGAAIEHKSTHQRFG